MAVDIVFVGESWGKCLGGLEVSTRRLAKWLSDNGCSVRVICKADGPDFRTEMDGKITVIRSPERVDFSFVHVAMASALFKPAKFIYVYGTGHVRGAPHLNPLLCEKKAPVGLKIGTPGDLRLYEIPKYSCESLDLVFVLNEEIMNEATVYGFPETRCVKISNGIDIENWRVSETERSRLRAANVISGKSFVIAGVGRLVARKNFPKLVEVVSEGFEGCEDVTLILHLSNFMRDKSEEIDLLQRVRSSRVNVRLVGGSVPPRETYAIADVLVTLGDREGAANVVLEALSAGCPVVAPNIPGHRVFLGKGGGILVQASHSEEIIRTLRVLRASKTLRDELRKAAINRASCFDIAVTGRQQLNAILYTIRRTDVLGSQKEVSRISH